MTVGTIIYCLPCKWSSNSGRPLFFPASIVFISGNKDACSFGALNSPSPTLSWSCHFLIHWNPGTLSGHLTDHIATSLLPAPSYHRRHVQIALSYEQWKRGGGCPPWCHSPARPCSLSYRLSARVLEAVCACYLYFLTSLSLHNLRQTGLCPYHSRPGPVKVTNGFRPSDLILTSKACGSGRSPSSSETHLLVSC